MPKDKNRKTKGKSLNRRFLQKKYKKAKRQGRFLYKCVGGAHTPNGCGYEWSIDPFASSHPTECPRCKNQYYKWLNFDTTCNVDKNN